MQERDQIAPIEKATPHGHSVSSKRIALSDMPSEGNIREIVARYDELPEEDILLLSKVATAASSDAASRMVAG